MKNHTTYRETIITMFRLYRANTVTLTELIEYIKIVNNSIKSKYKYPKDKGIWFRFFNNDTGATGLNDIQRDLSLFPTHCNYQYMIQCIDIAISNKKEFKIYFS